MTITVGSKVQSKVTFLARILAMIAGLTKDLTAKMSLMVAGASMTQAQILAKLAAIQKLFDDVEAAKGALQVAVAAKNAGTQDAKQFMADLKKSIEVQFGSHSPLLPDFGIALPKPAAARSSAQKAASAGLAAQTRKVRGTNKGKVQRSEITVAGKPGVVVVGPTGAPLAGVSLGAPVAPAPVPVEASGSSAPAPATPATNGATAGR